MFDFETFLLVVLHVNYLICGVISLFTFICYTQGEGAGLLE
jgi:hypothetical protein